MLLRLPSGAGRLDELFEALTLIQTGKIKNFRIVIMGMAYWRELIEHIRVKAIEPFGLKRVVRRHLPWPGERGLNPVRS
jgi:predicted Rossmann-fold nucleotide-binding protein